MLTDFQLYLASVLPLLVIVITCIARLNDIDRSSTELRWHFRRLGFVLVGGASSWLLLSPMWYFDYVIEAGAMSLIGQATVWVTTPNMPPWWRYITGEFRTEIPGPKKQKIFDKTVGRKTGAHPIVPSTPIVGKENIDD